MVEINCSPAVQGLIQKAQAVAAAKKALEEAAKKPRLPELLPSVIISDTFVGQLDAVGMPVEKRETAPAITAKKPVLKEPTHEMLMIWEDVYKVRNETLEMLREILSIDPSKATDTNIVNRLTELSNIAYNLVLAFKKGSAEEDYVSEKLRNVLRLITEKKEEIERELMALKQGEVATAVAEEGVSPPAPTELNPPVQIQHRKSRWIVPFVVIGLGISALIGIDSATDWNISRRVGNAVQELVQEITGENKETSIKPGKEIINVPTEPAPLVTARKEEPIPKVQAGSAPVVTANEEPIPEVPTESEDRREPAKEEPTEQSQTVPCTKITRAMTTALKEARIDSEFYPDVVPDEVTVIKATATCNAQGKVRVVAKAYDESGKVVETKTLSEAARDVQSIVDENLSGKVPEKACSALFKVE